jgi:5-methyltetrahydrofolate--homocysteine methyltransferase
MRTEEARSNSRVVIGTVRGDIHDIGKNIVIMLLKAALFDVIDLGTDVSAGRFVDAVLREKPDILAMSAMLNMTMLEMGTVVKEVEKAGLRKGIKIIVGGAPVTTDYARSIGADAVAKDAFEGVRSCRSWVGVS